MDMLRLPNLNRSLKNESERRLWLELSGDGLHYQARLRWNRHVDHDVCHFLIASPFANNGAPMRASRKGVIWRSLLLFSSIFVALAAHSKPLAAQTDVIRGRVTNSDG